MYKVDWPITRYPLTDEVERLGYGKKGPGPCARVILTDGRTYDIRSAVFSEMSPDPEEDGPDTPGYGVMCRLLDGGLIIFDETIIKEVIPL